MIARTWRGWTTADDGDRYLAYLEKTGLAEYRATPGNRGAAVLRRRIDDRMDFLLISFWDSEEVIRDFAGDDPHRAVFYPEDDDFLVERELRVSHFEVLPQSSFP